MNEPTPRQLAGFLRRLLQRAAVQVIDPHSRTPLAAVVELEGEQVVVLPMLDGAPIGADPAQQRWTALLRRLQRSMSLAEAEELAAAVEAEAHTGLHLPADPAGPARACMTQST